MKTNVKWIQWLSILGLSASVCLAVDVEPATGIKGLPTKIAFGSCSKQTKPQPILDTIVTQDPDLFVYLGDNIYGDTNDMDVLRAKYNELGAKEEFQNLRKNVPLIAVWDDHDYGRNDAGKEYGKKEASKQVFLDFWGEPKDSIRRKRPGIYRQHVFKDKGKTLQVILLDTRTFRDPLLRNPDRKNPEPPFKHDYRPDPSPEKTFLGKDQWKWLEEKFMEPADLRIICSSNQFSHEYNGYESWTNMPNEQKKMTDLIRKTKANGVLFISGDVHWGEISKRPVEDGYPIFDVTSSGLTETWNSIEENKYRLGDPCRTINYGLIEVDWLKTDPQVTLQIRNGDNEVVAQQTLALSEIAFADEPSVTFEPIYPNLVLKNQRPIALANSPDDTGRTFLVLQRGRILILPKDQTASEATVFLDFSNRKMETNKFEEGLLGLAFHPNFKTNGKFYVYYSQQNPKRSVISELTVAKDNPSQANLDSERVLLEIPQPFWNHNSGNMLFGADGFLYVGVGDGGKSDDVRRLAQNPWMLNGKILRIDVNKKSPGRAYGIPADNPLVGQNGVREEIYALGIRNPWGMFEDKKTGNFWFADVGQNQHEEINLLQKGGNYGWSYREGLKKFERRSDAPPEDVTFVDPIQTYGRVDGISVTGGVVYRGDAIPALRGAYLYGDWGTGNVWALTSHQDPSGKVQKTRNSLIWKRPIPVAGQVKSKVFQPAAFAIAADGEIWVASWAGSLYKMLPATKTNPL